MSKQKPGPIPARQPGYSWSMYHEHIFAALVRAAEHYVTTWIAIERQCKAHGSDMKLAAACDEIEEAAIPVILLAHSMVEALANWYLAMSCPAERFREIEYESLAQKWTAFPKEWLPKYALPTKHELCSDLRALTARRKRITHHKASIEANEQVIHAGDYEKMVTADLDFVKRVASLPLRLLEHLKEFDSASFLHYCTITLEHARARVLQGIRWERRKAANV